MADDARISTALPSHPKTRKLRKRLGVEGCWALVCLFLWVADNRADGNLAGLSDEDIELAADWSGKAGAFVLALVEVGFLDGSADSHIVHDWQDHNPWAASRGQRVEAARKAARVRWDACAAHADRNAESCGSHETAMPTTQPNPTTPNLTIKSKSLCADAHQKPKATRIPTDFQVTDKHRLWAEANHMPPPDSLIDEFIDFWKAKAGQNGTKVDWDATFRTWMRNAKQRQEGKGNGKATGLSYINKLILESDAAAHGELANQRGKSTDRKG